MARFTAWAMAYGAAVWATDRVTRSSGGAPGLLWFLFWLAAIVSASYYIHRLLGFIRGHVLWRLRRRLIVAYVFIGLVPIVLIFLLAALGAILINGQFAAFLVASNIREHFDELHQVNRAVLHEARLSKRVSAQALLDQIQDFYVSELVKHAANYPRLEITLRLGSLARSFLLTGQPVKGPVAIPAWLKREEFAGIVIDNGELVLRSVQRAPTSAGELTLILSQPLSPELLDLVGKDIGPVLVVVTQPEKNVPAPTSEVRISTPQGVYIPTRTLASKSLKLPERENRLDFRVFGASVLDPTLWGGESEQKLPQPVFVYVSSRIGALSRLLLATLGEYSRVYLLAFEMVAIIFLVIEALALFISYRLTRTMTRTVDRLYEATERVKAGDFSYRIDIPSRDQLSALGEAFDSMTASVERLLRESQEKSRLEGELEIAREVQRQLFPQSPPHVKGLTLYGVCKAARSVSGDYYDFLKFGENGVGLVLGDVSGKGISAALLMAAIQSALRAQFYDGFAPHGGQGGEPFRTADVVTRLNLQLHETTPAEKYVTFFFGHYDAESRKLTYTNAGHLPPVVFRRDGMERLRCGGTVVGLFQGVTYEQAETQLQPGDLVLAFTDGITEPENVYGEEFGEERVLEVVRHSLHAPPEIIGEEVYRSVSDWTGSPELQDDMTLVIAKATE
jgi:phosphoserine phosphatase RsbU/P